MKKFDTRTVVMLGLLTAVEIVLSRFCSIAAWNFKIGFGFVPVAAAAVLFGPLAGGIVGALGDFIGAVLFPIGAYFPGFTATAFLTGAVFGLFLHKKQTGPRILGAVAVNQLVSTLLLNTLWISILYGSPFRVLLAARVAQCAVLGPVQFLVIGFTTRVLGRCAKKAAA
jgi:Predicted membrane protein